jgi:hypothetical protein
MLDIRNQICKLPTIGKVLLIALIVILGVILSSILNISNKSGISLVFWSIFSIIVGVTLISMSLEKYNTLKRMENTVTSKIRSVAIGLSEIKGKVVIKEPLYSPINKEKCAGYKIIYKVKSKTPSITGFTIKNYAGIDYKTNDFYLEDETGKILVKAGDEEIKTKTEKDPYMIYNMLFDSNGLEDDRSDIMEINEKNILFANEKQKKEILEKIKDIPKPREIDEETKKELLSLYNFSKQYEQVINRIEIREEPIKEGKEVYVLGTVDLDDKGNKIIRRDINLFEINTSKELEILKRIKYDFMLFSIIGLGALTFSVMLLTGVIKT